MYSVRNWIKNVGCSFEDTILNHLYRAVVDLTLIAPSSNGTLKLIIECEFCAEVYGSKFNELKSMVLFF